MEPPVLYPGAKQHQALLRSLVSFYQDDLRILAVIVFGSVARGDWDEYSDLDLDVILADDVHFDLPAELERLCASFAALGEDAAIVVADDDCADIVFESLLQLSIRYHRLSETSPHIVDSMLVLAGCLDETQIAFAGDANCTGNADPWSQLLDRCLRYTLGAEVEFQRRHFWSADEVLHRARSLLMDIYALTHGGYRGYGFFDRYAEKHLHQRLAATLPAFDDRSLQASIQTMLDILENDLVDLSAGQLALTPAQKAILERVRQRLGERYG